MCYNCMNVMRVWLVVCLFVCLFVNGGYFIVIKEGKKWANFDALSNWRF